MITASKKVILQKNLQNQELSQTDPYLAQLESQMRDCFGDMPLTKIQNPEYFFERCTFKFEIASQINPGDTLGNFELVSDQPSKTTAIATKESLVGYLSKKEYLLILHHLEEARLTKKVQFLTQSFGELPSYLQNQFVDNNPKKIFPL